MKKFVIGLGIYVFYFVVPAYGANGVIGHWGFNEGTGQVAMDSSANGNHGQLGSVSVEDSSDPMWSTGIYGSTGLKFGNSFVSVPASPALEPQQTLSVEIWVRSSTIPPTFSHLISKGAAGCSYASWTLFLHPQGLSFEVVQAPNSGADSPFAGPALWDGKWHHIAGTYDGSFARLYVDGTEVGTGTPWVGTIGYGLSTNNNLTIGAYNGSCSLPFPGYIDEVTIWDRALTAEEVAARSTR